MRDTVFNVSHAALLAASLAKGDLPLLGHAMKDRLHQPYRRELIAGYDDIKDIATENGALAVYLSGAGPTMIAIWDGEIAALQTVQRLAGKMGWQALTIDLDEKGYTLTGSARQWRAAAQ
jgi:homoserine kinase